MRPYLSFGSEPLRKTRAVKRGSREVGLVIGWRLCLCVLSIIPVLMIAMCQMAPMIKLHKSMSDAYAEAGMIVVEATTGHRTVAAFGQVTKTHHLRRVKTCLRSGGVKGGVFVCKFRKSAVESRL